MSRDEAESEVLRSEVWEGFGSEVGLGMDAGLRLPPAFDLPLVFLKIAFFKVLKSPMIVFSLVSDVPVGFTPPEKDICLEVLFASDAPSALMLLMLGV